MAAALGAAYTLAGRVADAVPLLTQALEQATGNGNEQTPRRSVVSPWERHRCWLATWRRRTPSPSSALALAREHQERGHQAYALRLLGDIAARREPPESESAEAHYRQALALAGELGMRPLLAHCHLGLGTLYGRMGRVEQARVELTAAIELYRVMDMTFWLPQAEAALARVEQQ